MPYTLGELASLVQGRLEGDPKQAIRRVASLAQAGDDAITYFHDLKLTQELRATRAGAVILRCDNGHLFDGNRLIAEEPTVAFAKIAAVLHAKPRASSGIHSTAWVAPDAHVANSASIGPMSVVESGATIQAEACIGPMCFIGSGAVVDEATSLEARVTIYHESIIGKRCSISPGVVIGADGFGYANDQGRWVKIPQLGRVLIGDDVDIGANTTIDRGALGDTVIDNGVKLDNQIQIAHNVHIGEATIMAGCVGVAGSARIGKRCMLGGRASILGHLEIVDDVHVLATSVVTRSLLKPGTYSSCIPVQEHREWRKNAARIHKLERLSQRVKALEVSMDNATHEKEE